MNTAARSEDSPQYVNRPTPHTDDEIVLKALQILNRRVSKQDLLTSPDDVKNYLIMRAATLEDPSREVFSVMYLNSQHRLITVQDEFVGTLSQTSVYPRESKRGLKALVVRASLARQDASIWNTVDTPLSGQG